MVMGSIRLQKGGLPVSNEVEKAGAAYSLRDASKNT